MKLKLDDQGHAVLKDGHPVYVYPDGTEAAVDVGTTVQRISALNAEAKAHRVAKETAEATLAKFAGIEDPEAARKALQTIKNLDDKKLVDAGQVETIKTEINKAWEGKFGELEGKHKKAVDALHQEKIGGSFLRSEYITKNLSIHPEIAQATFGKHFKLSDDGSIAVLDAHGNPVFSRKNPGAPADFDEGLEFLVQSYPHRDSILKATQNPGNGTPPGGGGNGGGGNAKVVKRSEWEKMPPEARRAHLTAKGTIVD